MVYDVRPGRLPDENSATQQLIALPIGGCYSRALVFPADTINADAIFEAQRGLSRIVGKVIVRARQERPDRIYRSYSTRSFTSSLDVVVTVAVLREA
jgi:hypothetical protein